MSDPGAADGSRQRRIWLCADDYGISPAVNAAIRDLLARGRLNATSVLVLAPSLDRAQAVALAAVHSTARRAAIGLHVALTAPFRPASRGFVPTRNGAFLPLAATLRHALLRRFRPDLLQAEVAGQMRAFFDAFGRAPDFVDGHQHVHLLPQVSDAVLAAIKRMAPGAWIRQCGRTVPLRQRWGDPKGLLLDILSARLRVCSAACGIRTNPGFAGTYNFTRAVEFEALFGSFLQNLPDGGLVMCHPGFVDEELQRLDELTTAREQEYAFFAGERFPALLAAHGIALA
jgi:chitin disaccharide deacetylase